MRERSNLSQKGLEAASRIMSENYGDHPDSWFDEVKDMIIAYLDVANNPTNNLNKESV